MFTSKATNRVNKKMANDTFTTPSSLECHILFELPQRRKGSKVLFSQTNTLTRPPIVHKIYEMCKKSFSNGKVLTVREENKYVPHYLLWLLNSRENWLYCLTMNITSTDNEQM